MVNAGSSPLARGLRGRAGIGPCSVGIIPARAGFTGFTTHTCTVNRDHPRSRGVYRKGAGRYRGHGGSSPLARGLPIGLSQRPPTNRIIPARAGFTMMMKSSLTLKGDHPRSRGVYVKDIPMPWTGDGSSPLARGLRRGSKVAIRIEGIIPARAGFTRLLCALFFIRGDHPRSRGVYRIQTVATTPATGSSPLARGLRGQCPVVRRLGRIIPARAGFTVFVGGADHHVRDHPRSRGVYLFMQIWSSGDPGSSPLARGLRSGREGVYIDSGIIPARAGFTLYPGRY